VEGANIHGKRVLLRAARGDHFISLRTRERIAERKRSQLEAIGWAVEVVSLDKVGWRALRASTRGLTRS